LPVAASPDDDQESSARWCGHRLVSLDVTVESAQAIADLLARWRSLMAERLDRGLNRLPRGVELGWALERDGFSSYRHLAPGYWWEHDLFRKPLHTFRDHALVETSRNLSHAQRAREA
jgi:hypothetical protein